MGQTFVSTNDNKLVDWINAATKRLVFISPGLRAPVAQAMEQALERLGPSKVHIILDTDPEVCRLGYGNLEGLLNLIAAAEKANITINNQKGLRIGLVISDEKTLIYSPIPELIEDGSAEVDKPNGISLDTAPPEIEDACTGGEGECEPEIGKESVDEEDIEETKNDLEENPPKEFDIARKERVFNSQLQYVELEVRNYRLTRRTISLPAELFGVSDPEVKRRLRNQYNLFGDGTDQLTIKLQPVREDASVDLDSEGTEPFDEKTVDDKLSELRKAYMFSAKPFGVLIKRRDAKPLEAEVAILRTKLKLYKQAVKEVIDERLKQITDELLDSLIDHLRKNPPADWRKRTMSKQMDDDEIDRLFRQDFSRVIKKVIQDFDPEIRLVFKNITYQSFKNEDFQRMLKEVFGEEKADQLFYEYDAAPEKGAKV